MPPKNISYKALPRASPAIPPRIPPINGPPKGIRTGILPIAAPINPASPAPMDLNAALPRGSPRATDKPKSISAPTTGRGILFRSGLTNPRTDFAVPLTPPRIPPERFLKFLLPNLSKN